MATVTDCWRQFCPAASVNGLLPKPRSLTMKVFGDPATFLDDDPVGLVERAGRAANAASEDHERRDVPALGWLTNRMSTDEADAVVGASVAVAPTTSATAVAIRALPPRAAMMLTYMIAP